MPWYTAIKQVLPSILNWRDGIEIILLAAITYRFTSWLIEDQHKNLLFYFYMYCTTLFLSYTLGLSIFTSFIIIAAPIVSILCIILHQNSLQKNFVATRLIKSAAHPDNHDWLETVISTCLNSINNQKGVHCLIEHRDTLAPFIVNQIPLYADIQKNLFTMILESNLYDQSKMLLLTAQGRLVGINACWNQSIDDIWTMTSMPLDAWQRDTVFFTAKTDAIAFRVDPVHRTFDLIAQAVVCQNIPANVALQTIKKYLIDPTSYKGESLYAIQPQKSFGKQYQS